MAKERLFIQTEENMKESGKRGKNMEKELIILHRVPNTLEPLEMT